MWPLHSHRRNTPGIQVPANLNLLAILPALSDQESIRQFASAANWNLNLTTSLTQAMLWLANVTVPIVLVDRDLRDDDWRVAIKKLSAFTPSPCVILASAVADSYLFDEVIHNGGYDVVAKPLQEEELRRTLGLAFSFWKNRQGLSIKK